MPILIRSFFTGCQRSLIPCVTAKLPPISAFLSCLGQLWFWAPFPPSYWHIRVDSSEYLLPGPGEHNDSELGPLSPFLLPCMSRFSGRGVYLLQSLLLLNDLKRFHFIGVWCIFILNTCPSPSLILSRLQTMVYTRCYITSIYNLLIFARFLLCLFIFANIYLPISLVFGKLMWAPFPCCDAEEERYASMI